MAIKKLPTVKPDDSGVVEASLERKAKSKSKVEAMQGLTMLGINDKYLGAPPRRTAFPDRFNPDSRKHWDNLFANKEFNATLKSSGDTLSQWQTVIRKFMSLCTEKGCDPFASKTAMGESPAYRYLSSGRQKVCKLLDSIRLFEVVKFSDVVRQYTRRDSTFKLTTTAAITGYGDLSNLTNYLTSRSVGFQKSGDMLVYKIDPSTCVYVDLSKPSRPRMGYDISIGVPISHPRAEREKITNDKMNAYIDRNIWLPIVRAIKFATLKKKALF